MTNRLLHLATLVAATLFAGQAFALLPIESWRTTSGARVLFVESRSIPMLDVQIDFPAGSSRAPEGKSGVASLTRQMLILGAGELSEKDIAASLSAAA